MASLRLARGPDWLLLGGLACAAAAVAGVALLPLGAALVVGAGVAGLAVAVVRPVWLLAALAVAVPFGSIREVSLGGATVSAADALVALVAVAMLVLAARRRLPPLAWTPLLLPLAAWLGLLLYSVTTAANLTDAGVEVVKWGEFAVVLVATATLVRSGRDRLVVVGAVLLAGAAQALVGWYQFLTASGPAGFRLLGRFLRAYGTFGQPNPFAGFINLGTMLAGGVLAGALATGWWRLPRWLLVLAGGTVVVSLAALGMSFSRGAWLAAAVGACAILALTDRRAVKYMAAAFLVSTLIGFLGAFNLLPSTVTERFASVVDSFGIFDARTVVVTPDNYAVVERMATWQAGWEMFQAYPALGVGIGNFNEMYQEFALPGWRYDPGHAHNIGLNALAETGVIGFGVLLVFLVAQFWLIVRALIVAQRRRGIDPLALPLALGVMGAWVTLLVHNQLDNLYVHHMVLTLALLLGLAAGLVRDGEESRT